jgi:sporulation protein YlmC with PRC-barrel domain
VRPAEFRGKKVIASAKNIGSIADLEIDASTWWVTHARLELTNDMINTLGYHKPLRGKVQVLVETEAIGAVADRVALNLTVDELKVRIGRQETGVNLGTQL